MPRDTSNELPPPEYAARVAWARSRGWVSAKVLVSCTNRDWLRGYALERFHGGGKAVEEAVAEAVAKLAVSREYRGIAAGAVVRVGLVSAYNLEHERF